ncbi:hypothetical protein CD31A_2254 [Corynebacterium diphtheriae 31A]|nr:hypothetical protein CD31A_2254 [Corynebacterium diphtheriae 31A]
MREERDILRKAAKYFA